MTFESLEKTWEAVLEQGGARQRLLEDHPLRLFYGSDASSRAIFVLVTEFKPPVLQMSGAVDVHRGDRGDGTWALALTLLDTTLRDTYIGLCVELARRSSRGENPQEALRIFFETLDEWRQLLGRNPKRLSIEALRGLVAELSFALNELGSEHSSADVMAAWRGPYGAPQDFVLDTGELFEVKATQVNARTVLISSVDQLDPANAAPMALVLIPVLDSSGGLGSSVTLPGLLSRLRQSFASGSSLFDALDHRLSALGIDERDWFYSEQSFVLGAAIFYRVTSGFPRVERSDVPVAVDKLEYRIRLSGLADYLVTDFPGILWHPSQHGAEK